jgi:hypothetical protein
MKKIGLITYHAAHNYGAVLQAYAVQYAVEKKGCNCEIINFQPGTMKYFNALYKFPLGKDIPKTLKGFAAAFYRLLRYWRYDKKRRRRGGKFEAFVNTRLNITKEYQTVRELFDENFDYDLTITGSDQTWNIHCPLWGIGRTIDYSGAYFLGFVKKGRKASFASSISNTTAEELTAYKDLLSRYDYITVREASTIERVKAVCGKDVFPVLDPAFLLTKEEWMAALNVAPEPLVQQPYALLYSIHGHREAGRLIRESLKFANKSSLALVCVTPNACKKFEGTIQIYDAGPSDFLNLYYNASFIVAATFHAIAFSVIFRKPFIAFGNKYNEGDQRKTSLLRDFNLESCLISGEQEINTRAGIDLDYAGCESLIIDAVRESKEHLQHILNLA